MKDRLIAIARGAVGNPRFTVAWKKDYLYVTLDGLDVGIFNKGSGGFSPDSMTLSESILGLESPPRPEQQPPSRIPESPGYNTSTASSIPYVDPTEYIG